LMLGLCSDPYILYIYSIFICIVTSAQLRSRCDVWLALKASLQTVHHVLHAQLTAVCSNPCYKAACWGCAATHITKLPAGAVQQPMLQSCLLGLCSNPYAQLTAVQRPMLQSQRCASHCATGPLCHRGCPWQGPPAVQVPGCFSLTIIYLRVASAQLTSRCGVWLVLKAMALQYHLHRQRGFSPTGYRRLWLLLRHAGGARHGRGHATLQLPCSYPCYPAATLQLPMLPCSCTPALLYLALAATWHPLLHALTTGSCLCPLPAGGARQGRGADSAGAARRGALLGCGGGLCA
jgi:hypothetical protein